MRGEGPITPETDSRRIWGHLGLGGGALSISEKKKKKKKWKKEGEKNPVQIRKAPQTARLFLG